MERFPTGGAPGAVMLTWSVPDGADALHVKDRRFLDSLDRYAITVPEWRPRRPWRRTSGWSAATPAAS